MPTRTSGCPSLKGFVAATGRLLPRWRREPSGRPIGSTSSTPERGWTLLTFDDDFLSLVDAADIDHAGVIYISQHGKNVGELIRRLDALLEDCADRSLDGRVLYA